MILQQGWEFAQDISCRISNPAVSPSNHLAIKVCTCWTELGDNDIEDGDEEEGVGAEEEEDRPDVDPLQVGALHEGAAGLLHLLHHLHTVHTQSEAQNKV